MSRLPFGRRSAPRPQCNFERSKPVVVIARRMQQRDLRIGALDIQIIALLEIADGAAVAGHLRARFGAIRHAQLNLAAGAHHDRPVAQGVRADGRQHPHVEIRFDDGSAAGQRIGGRAGRRGDHDAVAAVRIDEAAVDRGFEVHGAAGLPFIDHDIVQGEGAHGAAAVLLQPRRQAASADPRCSARRAPCRRPRSIDCGLTSVMNPKRPRLMPSSGTEWPATSRAAYSSVPSPPIAMMRSARVAKDCSGQGTTLSGRNARPTPGSTRARTPRANGSGRRGSACTRRRANPWRCRPARWT